MHILFLSSWFPYPPDNGSRLRVFNLIKHLSQEHTLTLLAFSHAGRVGEDRIRAMARYCAAVEAVPLPPFDPNSLRSIVGFLSCQPRSLVARHSERMADLVGVTIEKHPFSLVIASEMTTVPYVAALAGVPKVFEDLELTVLREKYTSQLDVFHRLRYGLMWWKTARFVSHLLGRFDGCTVVSEQELDNVLAILPDCSNVAVIPNGVDLASYGDDFGAPEPNTLIFPGALTYDVNFDAADFFLREVFPRIKARLPDAVIRITGRTDGVPIELLPLDRGVVLTGYLDDVRPAIARSWACVVPLRLGSGTRLKILEAMALGTPVITTRKGGEGLAVTHGEHLLIAEDAEDFARCVVALLHNPDLRDRLSANGRRLVEARYAWAQIGNHFDRFLADVVQDHSQARPYRVRGQWERSREVSR